MNAAGLLQGRADPALDELGEKQAAAMGAEIRRLTESTGGVTTVVSSPLHRARQTAAPILDGADLQIDERWIELDYGQFEGTKVSDVPTAVWQGWRDDPDFAIDGGESIATLLVRVDEALGDLVERAATENIVVVSHVTPIKAAVAWALGVEHHSMFRCHLSHASLTTIGIRPVGPVLHGFNHTIPVDA